jgi:hypothetical protein
MAMEEQAGSLEQHIQKLMERWNLLTPVMLQMGIIDELLDRKLLLAEREGDGYTLTITREGLSLEQGSDPFVHASMRTTREQWEKIFAGSKTYATIFRFELEPERDVVYLNEMSLVERFSSVLQALVSLNMG